MIDTMLLERYAEAGGRRIVASGGKLKTVTLTAADKTWAEGNRSIETQLPLPNTCEVVNAFRRFWRVKIVDGDISVTMLSGTI